MTQGEHVPLHDLQGHSKKPPDRRNRTVLVTGFGAFPGAPRNPTEAIVAALERHRPRLQRLGLTLCTAVVPVRFEEIEDALGRLTTRYRPDVILHLGLASRRRSLSVETRAVNRAGPLHPDASGRRSGQVLLPGAPSIVHATYPATRILACMRARGIAAERSIDAGDYVCNAMLYRALIAGTGAAEIGFIHVPKARASARPSHRVHHARPTITDLTQAILLAILAMASRPGL